MRIIFFTRAFSPALASPRGYRGTPPPQGADQSWRGANHSVLPTADGYEGLQYYLQKQAKAQNELNCLYTSKTVFSANAQICTERRPVRNSAGTLTILTEVHVLPHPKYLMFGYDPFLQNSFQSFMHYHQMSVHFIV